MFANIRFSTGSSQERSVASLAGGVIADLKTLGVPTDGVKREFYD